MLNALLKVLPQYVLPQHSLSVLMGQLTHSQQPALKNFLIRQVIQRYGVNMSEALQADIEAFNSFNDFFTRELKPELRPITTEQGAIACPADGVISQAGNISDGQLLQAKGKTFSVLDLLGGCPERATPFQHGAFSTIYLSPKDYHRLHMPLTGRLTEMVHVPGRLFSVNQTTAEHVPRLFARNERVCCLFDTEIGPMTLVLVGAIFVSSIETVWHGVVTPPTLSAVRQWNYAADVAPVLNKGVEMGRFNMGSTIIVLFGKDAVQGFDADAVGRVVKMGEKIGVLPLS